MSNQFKNYIAGEWCSGDDATQNISPSDTSDVIGEFTHGSEEDVIKAVDAAHAALDEWGRSSPQFRHDILRRAADELFQRKEELGKVLSREEGKTLAEGIGEATRAAQVFSFFSGECLRNPGQHLPSVRPGVEVEIRREPVGVVGLITPWNFPIAIPAWKMAPALAFGNTVVIKPAESVPHSVWHLTDILVRAGLPEGVINLVMGRGSVVGNLLTTLPKVSAVSFTGSTATGRNIAANCVSSTVMKKIQLEMGGKNPLLILDDANLDVAVDCAINGAFFSTGQRCTASSRLIVTDGIYPAFVEAVTERLKQLQVGHALDKDTDIGPVVDEKQLQIDEDYIRVGQEQGATLHFGGRRLKRATEGYFLEPALFTDVSNDMRIAKEEIFGPVAAVIRVPDYETGLATANDTEYGLSSGICTSSLKYATHFKQHSAAGMCMVNLPIAGVDYHVPFGGRKNSSYGPREQGALARDFYTNTKTAYTLP